MLSRNSIDSRYDNEEAILENGWRIRISTNQKAWWLSRKIDKVTRYKYWRGSSKGIRTENRGQGKGKAHLSLNVIFFSITTDIKKLKENAKKPVELGHN